MIERYIRIQPDCVTAGGPRVLRVKDVHSVFLAPDGEDGVILQALTLGGDAVAVARFGGNQIYDAVYALHRLNSLLQDTSVMLYEIGPFTLRHTTYPSAAAMHESIEREAAAADQSPAEVGADA